MSELANEVGGTVADALLALLALGFAAFLAGTVYWVAGGCIEAWSRRRR